MMGLARLQPTKLWIHDGFLEVFWQNFNTNINPSHTILLSNDNSELILSIGVNIVMKFIIKHVSIRKKQ